jgi:hypothetical protein
MMIKRNVFPVGDSSFPVRDIFFPKKVKYIFVRRLEFLREDIFFPRGVIFFLREKRSPCFKGLIFIDTVILFLRADICFPVEVILRDFSLKYFPIKVI